MPEQKPPKELAFVNLEVEPYKNETSLSDRDAFQIVKGTWDRYSRWRHSSKDKKWTQADQLYYGDIPKRYWEGSNIPRSNLGIRIVFDQEWSVLPIIFRALFEQEPWIGTEATPFSSPQEAAQLADVLAYQMTTPQDISGTTAKTHLKFMIRDMLRYGTGAVELILDPRTRNLLIDWVSIKDLYFDPGLRTPIIDQSPAVIRRKMVSVEKLRSLRGVEGLNIPNDATLNFLAKGRTIEQADNTEEFLASLRGEDTGELHTKDSNPINQLVEVWEYWSDKVMIWVLGRKVVALNRPNPWGFKPFVLVPCFYDAGRAYGQSFADVLGDEQRLMQGLVNARIDELSLDLQPPRTRVRGNRLQKSISWRPGLIDEVDEPAKGVVIHQSARNTQNVFQEVLVAEQRANKRTGVNELTQTGVPTPGNANRTARGASMQVQAPLMRLSSLVQNIEDFGITPMLYKAQHMLNLGAPQEQSLISSNGLAPREILGKPVRFKMLAANKMVAKERLLQLLMPITNALFSEAVLKGLQGQGQTIDFQEWSRMFADATDTRNSYQLFRPMSEQEMQAAQQPPPEVMAQMQLKQMELQTRLQLGQMKSQAQIQEAQIDAESKGTETSEKSSREILKLVGQQQTEAIRAEAQKEIAKNRNAGNRSGSTSGS